MRVIIGIGKISTLRWAESAWVEGKICDWNEWTGVVVRAQVTTVRGLIVFSLFHLVFGVFCVIIMIIVMIVIIKYYVEFPYSKELYLLCWTISVK